MTHMSEVWGNETQYVDDIPWVQFVTTSNIGGNYIC